MRTLGFVHTMLWVQSWLGLFPFCCFHVSQTFWCTAQAHRSCVVHVHHVQKAFPLLCWQCWGLIMRVIVDYVYSTLLCSTPPYPVFYHCLPHVCLKIRCSPLPSPYRWDVQMVTHWEVLSRRVILIIRIFPGGFCLPVGIVHFCECRSSFT